MACTTDLLTVGEVAAPQRLRRLGAALLRARRADRGPPARPATSAATSAACCAGWRSSARRSNVGLSLDEIAAALATLPDGRTPTRADWTRLSRSWRQPPRRADRARCSKLRDGLDSCIGCGCLSLSTARSPTPATRPAPSARGPAISPAHCASPNTTREFGSVGSGSWNQDSPICGSAGEVGDDLRARDVGKSRGWQRQSSSGADRCR